MDIETLRGKKVEIADVSTLSPRDLYLQICKNRDFEISLVWQRAIFLTAFLIGCFTAYGSIVLRLFKDGEWLSPVANIICFLVTLVGIVISLIWIMMAKGSKAWYELYESAIKAFVISHNAGGSCLCGAMDVPAAQNKWREVIKNAAGTSISSQEPERIGCLLSTKGGAYSVSRINIFIGQFAFVVWGFLSVGHILIACGKMRGFLSTIGTWTWMVLILAIVIVGMYILGRRNLKSGYLSKRDKK